MCVCCVHADHSCIWPGVSGTTAKGPRPGMGRENSQQESNAGSQVRRRALVTGQRPRRFCAQGFFCPKEVGDTAELMQAH